MTKLTNSGYLPQMVEKYRKFLLFFGVAMGRVPHAGHPAGRKAPKRTHDDFELLFNDEDSNDYRFESLLYRQVPPILTSQGRH